MKRAQNTKGELTEVGFQIRKVHQVEDSTHRWTSKGRTRPWGSVSRGGWWPTEPPSNRMPREAGRVPRESSKRSRQSPVRNVLGVPVWWLSPHPKGEHGVACGRGKKDPGLTVDTPTVWTRTVPPPTHFLHSGDNSHSSSSRGVKGEVSWETLGIPGGITEWPSHLLGNRN